MMPEHAALFKRTSPILRAGDNVQLHGTGGVFTLSTNAVAAAATAAAAAEEEGTYPFWCPSRANGTITPVDGLINDNLVTGTPSVSGSGTQVVYAKVEMTLSVSFYGYVNTTFATETGWVYGVASSLPANTSTAFYVTVAIYVDGIKTVQGLDWNQRVRPKDDGTGGSVADALWWRA